jgi:hypothetical protein
MEGKKWYQSKTLWTNISAVVAALSAHFTGQADLSTTITAVVLSVVNIVLRLITREPITG